MYDYDNREDFEDYGKHCWLLTPWKGYRSATIVGQTDKGYIVQVSSGAEIVVYPDEIEIDYPQSIPIWKRQPKRYRHGACATSSMAMQAD